MHIEFDQIYPAARYFTMSNMALLELVPQGTTNIDQAYNYVAGIVESETETSIDPEFESWLKEVRDTKQGDYLYEEWIKVRDNWYW
jgi:hypothetical protein